MAIGAQKLVLVDQVRKSWLLLYVLHNFMKSVPMINQKYFSGRAAAPSLPPGTAPPTTAERSWSSISIFRNLRVTLSVL